MQIVVFGQAVKPTAKGVLKGWVKDSVTMMNLPQATIAVYKKADSVLVKYQLNDGRGKFVMNDLPIDTSLNLVVSFIGYRSFVHFFKLTVDKPEIEITPILLNIKTTTLAEVKIGIPPMQMRGDTLEFNADAYKTASYAVVGDLLTKLPGIIMWGDGRITVNGKDVTAVKVDGKTFFSGNPKIALENLPKKIVDKIQIIPNKAIDNDGIKREQTVTMNITLKEGKKRGAFGKVGGGLGNDKRFDAEAMVSGFTPTMQIALVGGANNVNKSPLSVSDAMAQGSYKQSAASRTFNESDFNGRGITNQRSAGGSIQNDWGKHFSTTGEYFRQYADNRYTESANTQRILTDSSTNAKSFTSSKSINDLESVGATISYHDSTFNELRLSTQYYLYNTNNSSVDSMTTVSSSGNVINKRNTKSSSADHSNNLRLNVDFDHKGDWGPQYQKTSKEDFTINYAYENSEGTHNNTYINHFEGLNADVINLSRKSTTTDLTNKHTLYTEYKSLRYLLNLRHRLDMKFFNSFYYNQNKGTAYVYDINNQNNGYVLNDYLTNASNYSLMINKPTLGIIKNYYKSFSNRYYKSLSISFYATGQFTRQLNSSQKNFQNIGRNYFNFLPDLQIDLNNDQTARYREALSFEYNTSIEVPSIQQLAPLIDSARQTTIYLGNINLKENRKQDYKVTYNYNSFGKYYNHIKVDAYYTRINNFISDSSYYDALGRYISTPVNVNNYWYAGTSVQYLQRLQLRRNYIDINFNPSYKYNSRPGFINNDGIRALNTTVNLPVSFIYAFSTIYSMGIQGALSYNINKTTQNPDAYNSHNNSVGAQSSLNLASGNLIIRSTLDYHLFGGDNIQTVGYTIWNANLSYRLTKEKQLEIKLSANDLLKQNKGFYTYSSSNIITTGQISRLQQYFVFSLAYYPRKFGF